MAGVGDAMVTVATWLMTVLGGDASLSALVSSVDQDMDVDQAAAYPFVVFTHMGALPDSRVVGMNGIMANLLYEIKVVDRSQSYVAAGTAYSRLHQLINRTGYALVSTALGQGQIIACYRQNPMQESLGVGGVEFRTVGGLYQFAVN